MTEVPVGVCAPIRSTATSTIRSIPSEASPTTDSKSSLQKRFSRVLTFLLSYTFSKTIGNVDSNSGATSPEPRRHLCGFLLAGLLQSQGRSFVTSSDIPQSSLSATPTSLPLGQGKRFLNHGERSTRWLEGWSVSGIHQYQSGRPIQHRVRRPGKFFEWPFLFAAAECCSFRSQIVPGTAVQEVRRTSVAVRARCRRRRAANPCQFYINPRQHFLCPLQV